MSTEEQQHENRVLGGYKGTLHNPNTSRAAKDHAIEVLEAHGETIAEEDRPSQPVVMLSTEEVRHQGRVLAGYKSTLSNSNASEEAKAHAREELKKAGLEESTGLPPPHLHDHEHGHDHAHDGHSHAHHHHEGDDAEHDNRVLGGYKAALHNPNTSDEAKAHAQQVLREHGEQV